jgi:hypothetical protein
MGVLVSVEVVGDFLATVEWGSYILFRSDNMAIVETDSKSSCVMLL